MNIVRFKWLTFFLLFAGAITAQADVFLDVVKRETPVASKAIDKKKSLCTSSLEFKQAIGRYIKHTDLTCFQSEIHNNNEKAAYKKELHYLFKNYGKFSAITLLSRLRSAHHLMMKQNPNVETESYQHYEQMCSALLLVCVQVFFNEMRSQLLLALHEVDSHLSYWRYQQDHCVSYFFGKSPLRWVMGKKQSQEIAYNIGRLERKQKELYTILGSIIGHAYAFADREMSYESCYTWIEQLIKKVTRIKTGSDDGTDKSKFDEISFQLEAQLKRVGKFKAESLASIATAKKANHFVRHWVMYATLLAASGYLMHYHSKNPEVIGSAINAMQNEASKFLILLLHPLQKIYERGKLVFEEDSSKQHNDQADVMSVKDQWIDVLEKVKAEEKDDISIQELQLQIIKDMANKADFKAKARIEKSLEIIEFTLAHKLSNEKEMVDYQMALADVETFILDTQLINSAQKLVKVGGKIPSDHAAIIERSNADVRKGALDELREVVEMLKDPKDGWVRSSSYEFDEKKITESINKIEKIMIPMKFEGVITNKKELDEYKDAFKEVKDFIIRFKKDAAWTGEGIYIRGNLKKAEFMLTVDEDYLNPLLGYLEIIEKRIIPIFEFIVDIAQNIIWQATGLIKKVNALEAEATQQLKEARQQLKDHELTLMFTSLIPLGITAFGATKLYKWVTNRNYSPIRIALADINSVLIEASDYLEDHDYGKLIYLIDQLRHKAASLKDSLAKEFLHDVAKLESRQYTAPIKREMVQNMFNKYTFLGRIAV